MFALWPPNTLIQPYHSCCALWMTKLHVKCFEVETRAKDKTVYWVKITSIWKEILSDSLLWLRKLLNGSTDTIALCCLKQSKPPLTRKQILSCGIQFNNKQVWTLMHLLLLFVLPDFCRLLLVSFPPDRDRLNEVQSAYWERPIAEWLLQMLHNCSVLVRFQRGTHVIPISVSPCFLSASLLPTI